MTRRAPRSPARSASAPDAGRWWYWVAAVPAVVVMWLASFAWLAVAATAEFGATGVGGDTVSVAFWLSLSVAGGPLAVVLAMLPVAVYADARALAAGAAWRPDATRWATLAAVGAVTVVGGAPVAVWYLLRRHREVGQP